MWHLLKFIDPSVTLLKWDQKKNTFPTYTRFSAPSCNSLNFLEQKMFEAHIFTSKKLSSYVLMFGYNYESIKACICFLTCHCLPRLINNPVILRLYHFHATKPLTKQYSVIMFKQQRKLHSQAWSSSSARTNVKFVTLSVQASLQKAMTSRDESMRHVYVPRFVVTCGPRMLGTLTPPTGQCPPSLLFQDSFSTHCGIVTVPLVLENSHLQVFMSQPAM